MGPLEWLNVGIATLIVLVGIGAINRMSPQTECTVILAFVTVMAGVVGYALGSVLPERWQTVCDTLLLGGVLALLIGTRKQTIWMAPRWMPWISAGVSILTWGTFFALVR